MFICPTCKTKIEHIFDEMREIQRQEWIADCSQGWLEIGRELKNKRQMLGITVRRVADAVGVSPATIRKFEEGKPVRSGRIIESAFRMFLELAG
ncbi:MAG: helix-turn-helix protein [Pelotomaculum sp. PtaB.Bin104]|nr:MAG: helix-turn-helix protein [Pelotomaculum sp. PtaB.Bin104]